MGGGAAAAEARPTRTSHNSRGAGSSVSIVIVVDVAKRGASRVASRIDARVLSGIDGCIVADVPIVRADVDRHHRILAEVDGARVARTSVSTLVFGVAGVCTREQRHAQRNLGHERETHVLWKLRVAMWHGGSLVSEGF
ncbi:MAG: hypothetical protein IPG81_19630 [Sandaracinaceae bacterium]|nr:hypothetical protein [Sandaracinaceae bacterium]